MSKDVLFDGVFLVANLLFVGSYAVRDILWLRLLSVVGGLCVLAFVTVGPGAVNPQAKYWQSVFLLINGFNLAVLLRERRVVPLSDEEERLRQLALSDFSPRDVSRILSRAAWEDAAEGETVISAGSTTGRLLVLVGGTAAVEADGERRAVLRDGQFVGEMSFITGGPASADVRAVSDLRYAAWDRHDLDALHAKYPHLRQKLFDAVGRDMARKLMTR